MIPCPECGGSDVREFYVGQDACRSCGQKLRHTLRETNVYNPYVDPNLSSYPSSFGDSSGDSGSSCSSSDSSSSSSDSGGDCS